MAQIVRFVDGVSYTEADQADFNISIMRPQGVLPESALGLLASSAIGSMHVRVGPGEAFVQGFQYKNTANVDLVIDANSSGSTRIDRVVLALDRATNTMVLAVVKGTPGAGTPALTQVVGGNWQFPLYVVTVVNGTSSIVVGNIVDERVYSRWPSSTLDPLMATDAEVSSAVSAAVASEAALRSAADTAEATARSNADTAEATARANADTTLTNAVAALNLHTFHGWVWFQYDGTVLAKSASTVSVTRTALGQYTVTTNQVYSAIYAIGNAQGAGAGIVQAGVGFSSASFSVLTYTHAGAAGDYTCIMFWKGIP